MLQILFYVTPIMYPADKLRERRLEWFVNLNPLAIMLEMLRQPILDGQLPSIAERMHWVCRSLALPPAPRFLFSCVSKNG